MHVASRPVPSFTFPTRRFPVISSNIVILEPLMEGSEYLHLGTVSGIGIVLRMGVESGRHPVISLGR